MNRTNYFMNSADRESSCPPAELSLFFSQRARVAQLDRASASGAEGCGFDPRLAYQPSLAAQRRAKAARHSAEREGGRFASVERATAGKPVLRFEKTIPMEHYHYVYTLESLSKPDEIYTGQTGNLKERLKQHNYGQVPHTSNFIPWEIRSATVFKSKERALAFERYLKSGSGRAFLKRHL
jgi:putative endonuclease